MVWLRLAGGMLTKAGSNPNPSQRSRKK